MHFCTIGAKMLTASVSELSYEQVVYTAVRE